MCHTSVLKQQSEQIEKFVENGMPEKIVKKVNSIINRKRRLENRNKQQNLNQVQMSESQENEKVFKSDLSQVETNVNVISESDELMKEIIEKPHEKLITEKSTSGLKDNTATAINAEISNIAKDAAATSKTTEKTAAVSVPVTVPAVAAVAAVEAVPVKRILTCPFTSNKRIVTVHPSKEEEKQKILSDIANFHFKDKQNSSLKTTTTGRDSSLDTLGLVTHYSKHFFDYIGYLNGKFQSSRFYTLVTEKPQPFTALALAIMVYMILALGPNLVDNKNPSFQIPTETKTLSSSSTINQNDRHSGNTSHGVKVLATIIYLALFATHFGAQIWMTFVSGLSLYFALPRHIFGQCQQILFPRYFLFNGILSSCMLLLHAKFFISSWSVIAAIQVGALAINALLEFTVRLYLVPPMLLLMHEKYKIENTVGSGTEVGMIVQGDLAQCPHYQRIHKAFRRSHMMIAICNMIVLMSTFITLFSLGFKIQIS